MSTIISMQPQIKWEPKQIDAWRVMGRGSRYVLGVGGSRSGKTFLFVRAILIRAQKEPGSRHGIFRKRYNAVRRSVWLDTLPTVARLSGIVYREHRQDGYVSLPNGSEIWFEGLDEKARVEKILGMEFATLFYNECSQIAYDSMTTTLTRLAQQTQHIKCRAFYDLNPTGIKHWTHQLFLDRKDPISRASLDNPRDYEHFQLNPVDNVANLDAEYLASLERLPERKRKRFLEGKYSAEISGALWPPGLIDASRVSPQDVPHLVRVVVGVDPSGAESAEAEGADEIGIVVGGIDTRGHVYVLGDVSAHLSPEQWARRVADTYHKHRADKVVAERNFGGEMVRTVLRTADATMPVEVVTASRGKHVRAEPVAALYEQGMVHHVGRFTDLEDQLEEFSTAGYLGSRSPDRADALVWMVSSLVEPGAQFRMRSLG